MIEKVEMFRDSKGRNFLTYREALISEVQILMGERMRTAGCLEGAMDHSYARFIVDNIEDVTKIVKSQHQEQEKFFDGKKRPDWEYLEDPSYQQEATK